MIDANLIESIKSYIIRKTGKSYFRNIRKTPDNIIVTCPFHKDGQESKPSATIRVTSNDKVSAGTFHCFTCGETMNILQMVQKILGPLYDESEVDTLFNLRTLINQSYIQKPQNKKLFLTPNKTFVKESELRRYRCYHPYLEQRGIPMEIAQLYDIGFDSATNQITFPIRDKYKRCIGIGRRSIDKKLYRYPQNMQKPLYGIYELDRFIKYLWVSEGPFNIYSLRKYHKNAVGLLGTGTENQYKELLTVDCRGYVLALDGDEAGRNGNKKLGEFLTKNNKKVFVALVPDNEDINSMTEEQFRLMNVVTYNDWLTNFYTK